MSSEEFSKKIDECKKQLSALRKDINYRDEQEKRGEATYSLDAQIRGQFTQINELLGNMDKIVRNYVAAPKDFNLSRQEVERRQKLYEQNVSERNSLQRTYDGFFVKKPKPQALIANDVESFEKKYETKTMTAQQLRELRKKQEEDQEQALQEMIGTVQQIKAGGKAIQGELVEQDGLLNTLEKGVDDNTQQMSKVRRNMVKLLDSSSNCCLITILVLEIGGVIALLILT